MDIELIDGIVDVYWNNHRRLYSVRATGTRLVIAHRDEISLGYVLCHVSSRGRDKVLETRQKYVHAWLRGTEVVKQDIQGMGQLWYNPFKHEKFTDAASGEMIDIAAAVVCTVENGKPVVWYRPIQEGVENGWS